MKIIKKFIKFCVLGFVELVHISYGLIKAFFNNDRVKIKEELDKDVIILGNGPSLNEIDLTKLKDSDIDVVCVNYFPIKNEYFWELKPKYMALLDPFLFYDESPKNPERRKELFDALEKVDWELHLICWAGRTLPIKNKNIIFEKISTAAVKGCYWIKILDKLYKKNVFILGAQNVTIGVGCYFVSKNVKNLYFAGIDMSEFKCLFVDENNNSGMDTVHSYGTERVYFDEYEKGKFYIRLGMYQEMLKQFYYLSEYAKRQGVQVTNLSMNSYVDVFEKKPLFHKEK